MAEKVGIINCPACGQEMVEIHMAEQGINLDVCVNGCGGIYFDNREFQHFDERHEKIDEIVEALKNREFIPVDESLPRVCPACQANMVKNYSSSRRKVVVDECYTCGGKFLDHDELLKIRNEVNSNVAEKKADLFRTLYSTVGIEADIPQKQNPIRKLFDSLIYGDK